MDNSLVRICKIKLSGFKNVNSGVLEMPSSLHHAYFSREADIVGIYGQNGSGKTAVIEALDFVQRLLSGRALPENAVEYIGKEHMHCTVEVTFSLEINDVRSAIDYTVILSRMADDAFCISKESLVSHFWNGERFEPRKTLLCFDSEQKNGHFTPDFRYRALVRADEANKVNLAVAQKLAQKEHCSAIFGRESRKIFLSAPDEMSQDYCEAIRVLHQYARMNLFVIQNEHSGGISLNRMIPFAFRLDMGKTIAKGDLPVRLDEPSVISEEHYQIVRQILAEMNLVLTMMIPGLSIDLFDLGERLMENGAAGRKIELVSKRGNVCIPLKYESEGILKIISILNVFMCAFNDSSMCLIVDELDSGIYEYLLGELLSVFEKGAKGQLIFTSHNLRPLEMLNKASIMFSTTNPDNRYIRLQHVKTHNNLRDMYLRSIILGGQREEVYAETDTVEIGRAFRRAGKAVHDGGGQ